MLLFPTFTLRNKNYMKYKCKYICNINKKYINEKFINNIFFCKYSKYPIKIA